MLPTRAQLPADRPRHNTRLRGSANLLLDDLRRRAQARRRDVYTPRVEPDAWRCLFADLLEWEWPFPTITIRSFSISILPLFSILQTRLLHRLEHVAHELGRALDAAEACRDRAVRNLIPDRIPAGLEAFRGRFRGRREAVHSRGGSPSRER
jgi:hypothetical protein